MKRFLKFSATLALLFLLLLLLLWWRLPDVINLVANRELNNRGYENSEIKISEASIKHLALDRAKLSGAGWDIQAIDSVAKFELQKLFKLKQLNSVTIDQLAIEINPENLKESDEPLTIAFLENFPTRELAINSGHIELELESGKLTVELSAEINRNNDDTVSFIITELRAEQNSPDGQSIFSLPSLKDPKGLLHGTIAMDGSNAALRWNLNNLDARGNSWKISEVSTQSILDFENLGINGIALSDTARLLPRFILSVAGTISLSTNELAFNSVSAQWISAQLELTRGSQSSPMDASLTASAGTLGFATESFEQVLIEINSQGGLKELNSTGDLSFLYDGIEGKFSMTQTTENILSGPSSKGEYSLSPMTFDYSDVIGRHLSRFSDLIFSGTIGATGHFAYSDGSFEGSSDLSLTEGSLSLSSSSIDAFGIQSRLSISSLTDFISSPGESYLKVKTLEAGDLSFKNTQLSFDILDLNTLTLTTAQTELFHGVLSIPTTTFHFKPASFQTQIGFERLSLNSIVSEMKSFNGTMQGAVSGHLPLSLIDGQFKTKEGYLTLADGETAKLNYNTKGLFEPSEPQKKGFFQAIGDKILNKLRLAPEKVVEDALGDLTIHELRIDLFPQNDPGTPAKIHLAGKGLTGKTTVPMVLDTNINGTTDELLQALLSIHSIGTPARE